MRFLATMQVLLAIPPATLWAGPGQVRKGFWLSFGFGPGSARMDCLECTPGGRETSFAGWFRIGGTIGRRLLLGWEGSGWLSNGPGRVTTASSDVGRTLGSSSVVALYYPRAASGFFAKVGAGLSYAGLPPAAKESCLPPSCVPPEGPHGVGEGITAGLGYDWRIKPNMSITSELSFLKGRPGDLGNSEVTVARRWRQDVLALGVGLTFH